jgi:hypothetical protein
VRLSVRERARSSVSVAAAIGTARHGLDLALPITSPPVRFVRLLRCRRSVRKRGRGGLFALAYTSHDMERIFLVNHNFVQCNINCPQSPTEAYATTYESLAKALGGFQNKVEIPKAAGEFVKRSAAVAKDRSDDLYAGASKVTGAFEQTLVGAVSRLADANRKIVEAVHQDAGAAFAAIDKLADAQSLSDAYAGTSIICVSRPMLVSVGRKLL